MNTVEKAVTAIIYKRIAKISRAVPSEMPDENMIINMAIEESNAAEKHDAKAGQISLLGDNHPKTPLDLSFKKNMADAKEQRTTSKDKIPRIGVVR